MIVTVIPKLTREEVPYRRKMSPSDGAQSPKPEAVKARMKDLSKVAKAVGREV